MITSASSPSSGPLHLHSFPTRRSSDLSDPRSGTPSPVPACARARSGSGRSPSTRRWESSRWTPPRSEEHTSELQSHVNLVCRLLLEKKNRGITIDLGFAPLDLEGVGTV